MLVSEELVTTAVAAEQIIPGASVEDVIAKSSVDLIVVGAAIAGSLIFAQPGRGGSQWLTALGDAQRTSWIRTDDKISVAARECRESFREVRTMARYRYRHTPPRAPRGSAAPGSVRWPAAAHEHDRRSRKRCPECRCAVGPRAQLAAVSLLVCS